MYQVNDTVLYSTQGVCRITEITKRKIKGKLIEYYVLRPVFDERSTIFVPKENRALTDKMRHILSPEEIYDLIKIMPDEHTIWIEDEAERRQTYQTILAKGNREALIKLIKTLYLHQQKVRQTGKKLHVADERFLKEAEKLLHEEFAHVLQMKQEQVLPFILDQIQIKERVR